MIYVYCFTKNVLTTAFGEAVVRKEVDHLPPLCSHKWSCIVVLGTLRAQPPDYQFSQNLSIKVQNVGISTLIFIGQER
jgi:hypothetical protein